MPLHALPGVQSLGDLRPKIKGHCNPIKLPIVFHGAFLEACDFK